mgnify:CR=1 FL=1
MDEMLIGSVFCLFGSLVMALFLWAVLEAASGKSDRVD